jgi:hypothetical protein
MIFWLLPSVFQQKFEDHLDTFRVGALRNLAFLKFDLENTQVATWCANDKRASWEEIFRCWISDATKFRQTNIVKVCGDITESDWESITPCITAEEAAKLVLMPSFLILENQFNDLNFIKCIVDKYTRQLIEDKITQAAIVATTGGIGEVKKKLLSCNDNLRLKCKMFVMIDSDCKNLHQAQQEAIDVKQLCEEKGISYHVLIRRMIENYYPLELLYSDIPVQIRENVDIYNKVNAFNLLNDEQRYCLHMKRGLKDVDAHSNIYQGINANVSSLLLDGFGNIASKYGEVLKQEKIHYAMHSSFDSNEIKELAQNIKNHLRTPV